MKTSTICVRRKVTRNKKNYNPWILHSPESHKYLAVIRKVSSSAPLKHDPREIPQESHQFTKNNVLGDSMFLDRCRNSYPLAPFPALWHPWFSLPGANYLVPTLHQAPKAKTHLLVLRSTMQSGCISRIKTYKTGKID